MIKANSAIIPCIPTPLSHIQNRSFTRRRGTENLVSHAVHYRHLSPICGPLNFNIWEAALDYIRKRSMLYCWIRDVSCSKCSAYGVFIYGISSAQAVWFYRCKQSSKKWELNFRMWGGRLSHNISERDVSKLYEGVCFDLQYLE